MGNGRFSVDDDLLGRGFLTLRLPLGLSEIITTYAKTTGSSVNHVLAMFLECGLIIYLKGENTLLETVRSLTQEHMETEQQAKKKR